MDEKTIEKTVDSINKGIEQVKEDIAKKADVDTLEKKYGELQEQIDKVSEHEYFVKQQEQLDQISADILDLAQSSKKNESIHETIGKQLQADDFKKSIKEAQNRKGAGLIAGLDLKDITTTDINSGTIEDQVEPGVAKAPWRENPVWSSIQKGVVGEGRDQVSWWEETSRTENATAEGEADYGSQSKKTWTKQSIDIKMYKAFTKVSRSSLEDWEYTRSEVLDLMNNELPRLIESAVTDGSGAGENLNGIITQADAFSKPANFDEVDSPNHIDAVRAIMTQIMNGDTTDDNKKGYMPNLLIVNPGTLMNMRGDKDENGSYIIPPLAGGVTNIDGVRIVPSLDLDAGEFLMGDFTKAKAYIKRNMRVSFHYENEDDVLNDLVLVLASMRLAGVKIATPHIKAFVTGTFANVINSIRNTLG
ncbi:MAG: phage major capsid protein [Perlabentimonas sp.]